MDWYYVDAETRKEVGPVNDGNFNRLIKEGRVKPETPVWRMGMDKWAPYSRMTIGAQAVAAASVETCSGCEKRFAFDQMTSTEEGMFCEACLPSAESAAEEEHGDLHPAGFWIRAGARLIDLVILNVVFGLVLQIYVNVAGPVRLDTMDSKLEFLLLLSIVIQASYMTWFLGRYGATPGKLACNLQVVRSDGAPISYGRALGRFFGDQLSICTLGAGFIMAAIDGESRALHDFVCDTRVVFRQVKS